MGMLKIVVPIYGKFDADEIGDDLEYLAALCQNNGNRDNLQGWHECPIKGLNDKNSRLECPFENEKYQYCTEITPEDWRSVLAENFGRHAS